MGSTNKYKYVLALPLIAMLAFGAYTFGAATRPEGSVPQGVGYNGMVNIKHLASDGTVLFEETNHNMLLLNGSNFTTSQLFGMPSAAAATEVENITLGNGTGLSIGQDMSGTDLAGITTTGCSGLGPSNTLVWISVLNATAGTRIDASGNVSANHLWTSACGSGTGIEVNKTVISSTTASFFAANQFTNVFLQSGDQLNVTWYVWIT